MKSILLSLFVLGFGLSGLAQTQPAADQTSSATNTAPAAATSTPAAPKASTSTTTPDNARYLADSKIIAGCQARVAAFNNKPCDVIFIGDSITEGWLYAGKSIWDQAYEPLHALNFGVSGDKTQNVLWRLDNMDIQSLKPKVAVLLIGTNNFDNTPHEIADGIKAILTSTQGTFPGIKIILVSVMPNERAEDKMSQVDSLIKNYDDGTSTFYLNLVPLMPQVTVTNPDGTTTENWKGLSKDRLHPDIDGYKIWADAMDPLLKKCLAGQ